MPFLDKLGLERLWVKIVALVNTKVPLSRTINGKSLSNNITLSASEIGAYTKAETDNAVSSKSQVQIVTWEADD